MKKLLLAVMVGITLLLLASIASAQELVQAATSNTQVVSIADDTTLADLINDYRVDNGLPRMNLSRQLAYVAAIRTYMGLLPGSLLTERQIDNATMPGNYQWRELTHWSDTFSLRSAADMFDQLVNRRDGPDSLLDTTFVDLAAVTLCDGRRCVYVIILGRPYYS